MSEWTKNYIDYGWAGKPLPDWKGKTMENETKSLGEALPEELARARMIQGYAKEIGPAGAFMVAMIEQDIRAAEKAMLKGDIVGMMQAYQSLKEIKE